jgi:hypothetical protein
MSGNSPASGVSVTFTAPGSGASGTFASTGTATETDTTSSTGVATSSALTANTTAGGPYNVSASTPGTTVTANFALTNTAGAPVNIVATSGRGQSQSAGAAFANPLVATVTDGDGNPVEGVQVTFTAPASGASGTFASNSTNTENDTTDINGNATSSTFTANLVVGGPYTVTATFAGAESPADFSLTNTAPVEVITPTSGSGQSATVSTAFTNPLVATVSTGGVGNVGVSVTFTAPASGASGTFASTGTNTETDVTGAGGVATSSAFTANATAGGPYTVSATAVGATNTANFSLTNTAVVAASSTYVYYLSGLEGINDGPNYYAVAGAVTIDTNGNVLGGEQDYNDAFGITAFDQITPENGALVVDPSTGQGTLTLTFADDPNVGNDGVETIGVQFVNVNHALIVQFDGTATSSGSLDLQNLTTLPTGGFAFALSGVDTGYYSTVAGGVFTINGTAIQNGVVDVDDFGAESTPTLGTAFGGTISGIDTFGRGTLTGTGLATIFAYYVVGSEAMRIIDVDAEDSALGSAFGQGTSAGSFGDGSLTPSVFGVASNSWGALFDALGSFTIPSSGTFSGIADDDEEGSVVSGAAIGGTYSIQTNGYGGLTITPGDLGDVSLLGVYMTDPTLNLNDPNNTATGLGGALVTDLDGYTLNGTGVLTPQTNTSPLVFTGSYAFGAQQFNGGENSWEVDLVGQGSVADGALAGTGLVSDPGAFFTGNPADSGVGFSATPLADGDESSTGRYTMLGENQLVITIAPDEFGFEAVLYQASGGTLYWMEEDTFGSFLGPIELQGSLTGLPAVKKAGVKSVQPKQKH